MWTTRAILIVLLAGAVSASRNDPGRALLQAPSPASSLRIPANGAAVTAAQAAIRAGEGILPEAGNVNLTRVLQVTLTGGHEAAEELYSTAPAGQASATLAGVAATGAALLAAGAAETNNPQLVTEARRALSTASSLVSAVRDEDILTVTDATFANLALLTALAHDGSLVHYWLNSTSGPRDNATFADTVDSAGGIYDEAEDQIENGASQSLTVIGAEIVGHNLLGAIYAYNGNNTQVQLQSIYVAQALLKAVRSVQTNTACSATWSTVDPAAESALSAATTAATTVSDADIRNATTAANALVQAANCAAVSPALAPASALASAGK